MSLRASCWCAGLLIVAFAGCDADLSVRRDAGPLSDAPLIDPRIPALDALLPMDTGGERADAGVFSDASMPDGGPPPPLGRVIYPSDRSHSPITSDIGAGLAAIASRRAASERVLAKVGDSITVSTSFLHCFAAARVDLAGRTSLQPTIDYFLGGDAAGTNPFTRTSLSATVGWSASAALAGSPAPLDQEISAISPRYASVMFGTNDSGFRTFSAYGENMLDITDRLIASGAIPILSTLPPRDDNASADATIGVYNLLVRGIAQGRGVPLVDLNREMLRLAGHGLAGDGVHPSTASAGACVFTALGLEDGYNVRNLLVIEALDRARRALGSEAPPDSAVARTRGAGTHADPYVVDTFPWTDLRSTTSGEDRFDRYDACSTADESGPEIVYRLEIPRACTLHVWLVDRGTVDTDLHLLDASAAPTGCLTRNDREISAPVAAGTYTLVVDSWVDAGGVARAGEYLLAARLE